MQWRNVGFGAGLLLAMAPALAAKEASFWVKCDGMPAPEPITTTLGRVVAVSATFGLLGAPERPDPVLREPGAAGVAACTAALSAPALTDDFWARRANLMQARAVHHLEAGDSDAALADLAGIDKMVGTRGSDIFYQRSLGVGNALLASIALAGKGDFDAATAAAARAAAIRPYAAIIQSSALKVMLIDRQAGNEELAVVNRLYLLAPDGEALRVDMLLRAQAWQAALDAAARLPAPSLAAPGLGISLGSWVGARVDSIERGSNIAYAHAMVGDGAGAWSLLTTQRAAAATLRSELAAQLKPPLYPDAEAQLNKVMVPVEAHLGAISAMIAAQLALAEGKPELAVTALNEPQKWPRSPAFATLVSAVHSAAPNAALPETDAAKPAMSSIIYAGLFSMLPPPENPSQLNGYTGQIGFGLKVNGFRTVKPKAPATHTTVEFVGANSTRGAVEEMMLLRAAELAQQAGKSAFIIVGRRDYSRWSQMTYRGSPVGNSNADGFKSEVDVEFVDPAALPLKLADAADRVIMASDVVTALWPVYQRDKPMPGTPAAASRAVNK